MLEQYHGSVAGVASLHPLLRIGMLYHRNTRGQPLSFRGMPYLIEMYSDIPKLDDVVVRKAVQTGVSELCIQLALERAGWSGRIVAYVLPSYAIRNRFVQNRIDPLLQSIPEYKERCTVQTKDGKSKKAAGNLMMKAFGEGTIMFLGSNTPGDFVEFTADMLIIDELDLCDPSNLALAKDRLRASPYPQEMRLGNPSLPGVGISKLYEESDARRWFFRCTCCGHRQPMDWFANVVRQTDDGEWVARDTSRGDHLQKMQAKSASQGMDIRPVCVGCNQPFEREAMGALWVPEHHGRQSRGYSMSRLDVLSDSLWALNREWISAQNDTAKMAAFQTSVLGKPYEFGGARVTHAMLGDSATRGTLDYLGGAEYGPRAVTSGIDVGNVLNITVSTVEEPLKHDGDPIRQCRWVGAVRTFDEVSDILRRYRVDTAVIDAAPEMRMAQGLRDKFTDEGTTDVWLARFHPTPRVGVQKYGMRLDHQNKTVTVDRTQIFDATFDDIRHGTRVFPEDVFTVFGWSDQMRAPIRVLDETRGRIVWQCGGKADHYRLSDIYDRAAFDLMDMGGSYGVI